MKAVKWGVRFGCVLMAMSTAWAAEPAESKWTPCGWGGGGFYYSAAFSPSHNGVIYLGGDVCGIAKSEDHGLTWRMINRGIAGYGVFSIGQSQLEDVRAYIAGQEEHHRKVSFQDEFRRLLQRYEIEFDERYVWD